MRTPFILLLTVLFTNILGLTGCGKQDSAPTDSTAPATSLSPDQLVLGNGAEPRTLDPDQVTDTTGMAILNALFDPLVDYDPLTGQYQPVACERWEISEDGLTYRFFLHPDAKWSNGDPVTAEDWEAGFRRAIRPEVSTPYIQNFRGIRNALAYNNGEAAWEDVGIRATDTHVLTVEFETPKLAFIRNLSQSCFFPIHRPSMEPFGAETSIDTEYYRGPSLVSNGAYRLTRWSPDEELVAERNPHYIFNDQIQPDSVRFVPIENVDTEVRAFDNGDLHKTASLPSTKLNQFRLERADVLREDDLYGTYFFRLNVERPPLDDPRVRRALALAIDRYEIVNFVTQGRQPEATSFVPENLAGYVGAAGFEENVDEARRLLAEAGYPDGNGFPELTLIYNTSEGHRAIAQAVQEMWKNALGIEITLLNQEWKVFLQTVEDGEFDIARSGWVGGTDPEGYLDLFNSNSGNNHGNYSNPAFDRVFIAASQQPTQARRMELFREAETIVMEDMPVIPIYHYKRFYFLRPEVENWPNNPTGSLIFRGVSIAGAEAEGY